MSSPRSQSENPAPPSLLSPDATSPVAAVTDLGAAPAAAEVSDQNVDLINPHPVLGLLPSWTPPLRPRDSSQGITKDDLRSCGPSQSNQRQSGPSLLSQALASARGIQIQKLNNGHISPNPIPIPNPNLTYYDTNCSSNNRTPKVQSNGQLCHSDRGEELLKNASSYTASRSIHVKNGEHEASVVCDPAQTISNMATPAITPIAAPSLQTRDPTVIQHHCNPSNLTQAREFLMEHRDFLIKTKGRASTSLDLDRSTTEFFKSRALSVSASPDESALSTISTQYAPESPATGSKFVSNQTWPESEFLVPLRLTNHPEKTEKIWSIGSGDVEQENGLVEKSVAEAMAGVEPNTRSRKASYSLRFFKEGLPPEHKPRRKDIKPTPREKQSPTSEKGSTQGTSLDAQIPSRDSQCLVPQGSRDGDPTSPTIDYFNISPPDTAAGGDTTPVALRMKHRQDNQAACVEPIPPPTNVGPIPVSEAEGVEGQSESPDSHNGHQPTGKNVNRNSHEDDHQVNGQLDAAGAVSSTESDGSTNADADAEESGEEKISSAVFLPHKEMPAARAPSCDPAGSSQTQRPRSISRSSSHPWLVKADEPELESKPDPELDSKDRDGRPTLDQSYSRTCETPVSQKPGLQNYGGNGSVVIDDPEISTYTRVKQSSSLVMPCEDHAHQYKHHPQPLEAIELIPYKHQVGGHTTLWRFSRRAVCKQLSNRENEFYETIERYHRDLLPFLPRYIGVLNVTFQKQPRRKSTVKRDDALMVDHPKTLESIDEADNAVIKVSHETNEFANEVNETTSTRVISQSLANSALRIPTVTFDDNKHILPRNLLQPTPPPNLYRRRSTSATKLYHNATKPHASRPHLDERPNSWGATTINKRLRNEVFNDAFLKEPVEVQKHRRPHQRNVPRPTLQRLLRPASSDSNLADIEKQEGNTQDITAHSKAPRIQTHELAKNGIDSHSTASVEKYGETTAASVKDTTGTSAPEPETLKANMNTGRRRRRYSAGGLRRRPEDVRESRGNLKYFEEADDAEYKNGNESSVKRDVSDNSDNLTVLHVDAEALVDERPESTHGPSDRTLSLSTTTSTVASALPSPTAEFKKIPRPINPKEAKTQSDRVEYFLLMEDLTAGMKRPCMMDLKMGTRQYGVDASLKKQKSQQEKCRNTTSAELGVRICGLQVWNVRTQSYYFQDKYFGREVKIGAEFQHALQKFLYNGVDLNSILRHIPVVLKRLAQLEKIVQQLRGYRFYAASLLMFYDGDDTEEPGYETMYDSTTDAATDSEETSRHRRKNPREIDFKIADFANSLTPLDDISDKACPPQHPHEPDSGFLKGLRSLQQYFLQIQNDVRSELNLCARNARGNRSWAPRVLDESQPDFEADLDTGSLSL